MTALATLTRTEFRLWRREAANPLLGIVLPPALVLGLGAIPALREPAETFGGQRFIDYFIPGLLAVSLAVLGLQTLPTTLASYREKGILRRFSASPMRPASVLLVQMAINLVSAAVGAALMVVVAVVVFDVPAPRHPAAFGLTFVVGTAAVFAIGLVIAAVARTAKAAGGIGVVAFMLTLFFAGVYLPKFLLPEVIVRIGDYVPPGIGALQAAWTGDGPAWLQLVVLAAVAAVATVTAVRVFRWE